jgi:hypothetical protein
MFPLDSQGLDLNLQGVHPTLDLLKALFGGCLLSFLTSDGLLMPFSSSAQFIPTLIQLGQAVLPISQLCGQLKSLLAQSRQSFHQGLTLAFVMVELFLHLLDLGRAFPELALNVAQPLLNLGGPLLLGLTIDLQRGDLAQDFLALLAQ